MHPWHFQGMYATSEYRGLSFGEFQNSALGTVHQRTSPLKQSRRTRCIIDALVPAWAKRALVQILLNLTVVQEAKRTRCVSARWLSPKRMWLFSILSGFSRSNSQRSAQSICIPPFLDTRRPLGSRAANQNPEPNQNSRGYLKNRKTWIGT